MAFLCLHTPVSASTLIPKLALPHSVGGPSGF